MSLEAELKAEARRLGFAECGIADAAAPWPDGERLAAWIADGAHGDMVWMAETLDRRSRPQALWPQAASAVMLAMSYAPAQDPLALLERRSRAAISAYAARRDYHDVIKGRVKTLGQFLARRTGATAKAFVDTAPLMEKPLAARAGLGWQGKHTNLVSRRHGSWLLLGALLTTARLAPDPPEADHCGSCSACLDICPTAAFPAPYRLDARRCLAYLSIEHKGPIPREFRAAMGNRVFGCDDCLAICPWNKFAEASAEALGEREALQALPLEELAALDDAAFRALFAGTPIKRTGRDRFVRNVLIAIGNSGDPALAPAARARLADASPLVRGAAIWALSRLDADAFMLARHAHAPLEPDAAVREEWGL